MLGRVASSTVSTFLDISIDPPLQRSAGAEAWCHATSRAGLASVLPLAQFARRLRAVGGAINEPKECVWVLVRFDAPPAPGAVGTVISYHHTPAEAEAKKAIRDREVGPHYAIVPRPASDAVQPVLPSTTLTFEG
jgi:hypothetical protein